MEGRPGGEAGERGRWAEGSPGPAALGDGDSQLDQAGGLRCGPRSSRVD